MCQFVVNEDLAIVPEFINRREELVKEFKTASHFLPFTAIDLGYIDATGALLGYYDFKSGKIHIQDEFLTNKATSDQIVKKISDKEINLWNGRQPEWRVCDGPPQHSADLCKLHKFQVSAPRKDRLEAMVNELRLLMKQDAIRIHPRCKQLICELQEAVWNTSRTKFARVQVGEKRSHYDLLAALVYFIRAVNKYDNPYPANVIPQGHITMRPDLWNIDDHNTNRSLESIFKSRR